MGRKTWDSIPPRFRPLKGRLNVVLSRSHVNAAALPSIDTDKEPLRVASLSDAVEALRRSEQTGKVFVIGGAEIYRAALQEEATKRILLTRVLSDFECDTLFPLTLQEGEGEWTKKSKEELDAWVGEDVAQGEQEENGTKYVYEMYERD
jgi:dihydrofolate reductase